MNDKQLGTANETAQTAARAVGQQMRLHLNRTKRINQNHKHDIKLELDVRSQN